VCQFVAQQLSSGCGVGRVGAGTEDDVLANGVGPRVQRLGGTSRVSICMHPDSTEVVPKGRTHFFAKRRTQRLSAALENLADMVKSCTPYLRAGRWPGYQPSRKHRPPATDAATEGDSKA
jgi:hypothetical protein